MQLAGLCLFGMVIPAAPAPPFNVLMLVVDDLRAEFGNVYGAPEVKTPHLDQVQCTSSKQVQCTSSKHLVQKNLTRTVTNGQRLLQHLLQRHSQHQRSCWIWIKVTIRWRCLRSDCMIQLTSSAQKATISNSKLRISTLALQYTEV